MPFFCVWMIILLSVISVVVVIAEEDATKVVSSSLASTTTSSLPAQPCFTKETLPTCDIPADVTDEYNAQEWCYKLVNEGYIYPVNYMYTDAGFTWHTDALWTIPADSQLCAATKQVYHQCYWCTPFITDNYCRQAPVCYPYQPVLDEINNNDLADVCETFKELRYMKRQEPITMELCNLREFVSHQCLDVCYNLDPSTSCFTPDNPPSCEAATTNVFATASGNVKTTMINVQETCASLEWFFQQDTYNLYNTSTHGAALASLHQDSDLCHTPRLFTISAIGVHQTFRKPTVPNWIAYLQTRRTRAKRWKKKKMSLCVKNGPIYWPMGHSS